MTLMPMRLRSSIAGSAVQARKLTTSDAIRSTVAGVPSPYATASSESGGAMAVKWPGK